MARGGGIDRPIEPAAKRVLVHHQHQYRNKALVIRPALDLGDGHFGVLCGDHDGRAQPWVAVEEFCCHPLVDRVGEGGGDILAHQQLYAIQAVTDCDASGEGVEGLCLYGHHIGGGQSLGGSPIGARGQRRILWISDGL